jgi:predicted dehydrogenase
LQAARKFAFDETTTNSERVLSDPEINTIVITTRHDTHAALVEQALWAGKNVFVEKPLALNQQQLEGVERARAAANGMGNDPVVMVGFNRRFAPHVEKMKSLLKGVREPKALVMTVNAGAIPPEHWTQDREAGGGRIIGEACHFIDLLRFIAASPISAFEAAAMGSVAESNPGDSATITLRFEDGSIGTIIYLANGHKSFPKERLEVFAGGRTLQLDNFRKLTGYGWPGFGSMRVFRQDKGQKACAAAFIRAVKQGGPSPIPFDEILEVSRITIAVAESLK